MCGTCICDPFPEYRPVSYIFEPVSVVLPTNPYYNIAQVINKYLEQAGCSVCDFLNKEALICGSGFKNRFNSIDLLRTDMSKLLGSGARVICLIDRATHNNSINESCDLIRIPSLGADSGREDLPVANDAAQYLHPVRTGSRRSHRLRIRLQGMRSSPQFPQ
jgi:hypothetical protein